jgi:riboflavin synthase
MFTGIIKSKGHIQAIEHVGDDVRLHANVADLPMREVHIGDSISVNGACLTVIELTEQGFWADVSNETLDCTTLGTLEPGSSINLEPSITPSTAMGGHMVSGHVDGKGRVLERYDDGRSTRFVFEVPRELSRYIASKGSICVDGISLTVNGVSPDTFAVNIIPHTLDVTTMGVLAPGEAVNLEVDVIARYLERLIGERDAT